MTDTLSPVPLPSPQRLLDLMLELGCSTRYQRDGVCSTHGGSLLIHDGGRIGCRAAWEASAVPPLSWLGAAGPNAEGCRGSCGIDHGPDGACL